MIRSLLLAAGFLIVTIALLALQPSTRDGGSFDASFETAPVTRGDAGVTQTLSVIEPVTEASRTVVAPAPQAAATPEPTVTEEPGRSAKAPLTRAIIRAAAPRPTVDPIDTFLEPSGEEFQDQVAMMTRNILEELRTPSAPPAPREPTLQEKLLSEDLAGTSAFEIQQMLRAAVLDGDLTPDGAYYTALGDLDVNALMLSYLPNRIQTASTSVQESFMYRVQPSDSLAGLSVLFFGDATRHAQIFAANSGTLPAPNQLSPGMLIRIPAL